MRLSPDLGKIVEIDQPHFEQVRAGIGDNYQGGQSGIYDRFFTDQSRLSRKSPEPHAADCRYDPLVPRGFEIDPIKYLAAILISRHN